MPDFPYDTRLNVLHGPLERIDVPGLVAAVTHPWYNQTLCRVNDSVVRLGVVCGDYHWHKHDNDDEFFFVLEGSFLIDLEPGADGVTPGRVVTLAPREGFVVPKGVVHRESNPSAEPADIVVVRAGRGESTINVGGPSSAR